MTASADDPVCLLRVTNWPKPPFIHPAGIVLRMPEVADHPEWRTMSLIGS